MSEPKHKSKDGKKQRDEGADKEPLNKKKPLTDRAWNEHKPKIKILGVPSIKYFRNRCRDELDEIFSAEGQEHTDFKLSDEEVIHFGEKIIIGKLLTEKRLGEGDKLDVEGSIITIKQLRGNKLLFDVRSDDFNSENNESSTDAIIDMGSNVVTFSPGEGESIIARIYKEARHLPVQSDTADESAN